MNIVMDLLRHVLSILTILNNLRTVRQYPDFFTSALSEPEPVLIAGYCWRAENIC